MDQQALSNAFMSSFPGIQANSSEAANVQNGSKTTNIIEHADFTSTTESTGKFDMFLCLGLAEAIIIWLRQSIIFSNIILLWSPVPL